MTHGFYPGGFTYPSFPVQFGSFGNQVAGGIQDYFGGRGGTNGMPVWGGAGIGEAHSNGIDRRGRGWYPFPTN